jgi:peptidase M28-like protein
MRTILTASDATTQRRQALASGLMIALLGLVALVSIEQHDPPAALGDAAPSGEFSAGRAMGYVRQLSKAPHPVGSEEHAEARDFIFGELAKLGLHPQIQRASVVNDEGPGPSTAGTIENVIGRLQGQDNSKPIILAAHYDTVATSPGASDDGASVATLLETLRALKTEAQLRNDVIFLFTDGEEPGLLGAKAFVQEHPWAREGGLILNFEARGNRGASIMFETSENNGWLIDQVGRACPNVVTSSLLYEIYRLLPNDTDLSVFKKAGFDGLNFAYINGLTHYHSGLDTPENLDERSLQHHGSYALSLARHFGNLDLRDTKRDQSVFFSAAGLALLRYPQGWATPLSLLAGVLLALVIAFGLKKRRLRASQLIVSFFAVLLSIVAAGVAGTVVWLAIINLQSSYRSMAMGDTYNSGVYMLGFVAMAVALTSTLHIWFRRKLTVANLAAGGLLVWLLLTIAITRYVPGATYLCVWPLVFATLTLAYELASTDDGASTRRFLTLFGGAIPAVALLAPMISILFVAITVSAAGVVMALIALLLSLLIPHLNMSCSRAKWMAPGTAALVSASLMLVGSFTSSYDGARPKPNSLFYCWNADTGKAVWASSDRGLDEYTSRFLPEKPEFDALSEYLPLKPIFWRSKRFLKGEAPPATLAAPTIVLRDSQTRDGVRTLRLAITSTRRAPIISVSLDSAAELLGAAINGTETRAGLPHSGAWGFSYYAPPEEGIEVTLNLKPNGPINLRVVDESYGLPDSPRIAYQARPRYMIPTVLPFSNSTLVSKSFVF